MSNKELTVQTQVVDISPVNIAGPMSLAKIVEMATLIQQVSNKLFQEGTHYGKIPGTEKPTLFQAGAQKLALVFHLSPTFQEERLNLPGDHREYIIKCILSCGGAFVAQGVGSCSTMESKYRYRTADASYVPTGNIVPGSYFQLKNPAEKKRALLQIMDEQGNFGVKKVNGTWQVVRYLDSGSGKVEHPNIADVYNTVLKMGKKRAYVDAILNATGASDTFTQDLEDLEENVESLRATEDARSTREDAREGASVSAPVSSHSTEEKRPQTQSSVDSGHPKAESVGLDWKKVVCHIGRGTKDKKLAQLTVSQLQTLKDRWGDVYDFSQGTQQDKRLKLAVEIALDEIKKKSVEAPSEAKKEEKQEANPDIGIKKAEEAIQKVEESKPEEEEDNIDMSVSIDDVEKLKDLVSKEGLTEEEFIQSAKDNFAIDKEWPGRNLDDLDDGKQIAMFVTYWDELMVKWGERKPAKK